MRKKISIIGSGIGGLGAACIFAKAGHDVTVFEKNDQVGGRAGIFSENGFTFDMGPSWYLMPDVFEHFYSLLGEKITDHLSLGRLSPSYRIFFKDTEHGAIDIFSDLKKDLPTFERLEPGSSEKLKEYLSLAKLQYEISYKRFMFKNYSSIFDFFNLETLLEGRKLRVFEKMDNYVSRFFSSEELKKIMQYTLVFLGSSPYNTPALYSIMSHIDFNMGVFYPMGGIYEIIKSLKNIAESHGVKFRLSEEVSEIIVERKVATGVRTASGFFPSDAVISNGDIHHTETKLLSKSARSYDENYWRKKVMAPSAFIMYLGVKGSLPSLIHHNLVFSRDWQRNFAEIFDESPTWPSDPSFYISNPSKTDPSVAPAGDENLFVLVPMAPGVPYEEADLEKYASKTIKTMERVLGVPDLGSRIIFKRYFCVKDFESRYHSYKGTALGLAHTLSQTAAFRPDTVSKKVSNLYYVGAGTNPGIGMPICLISAELVYKRFTDNSSSAPLTTL